MCMYTHTCDTHIHTHRCMHTSGDTHRVKIQGGPRQKKTTYKSRSIRGK